ncbi:MAG TPA: hypothetical protein VGN77_02450, partial [Steroidobacteraceae bacterium]|nr:hypothetical protein [Steroidobacteraceae bacterium]
MSGDDRGVALARRICAGLPLFSGIDGREVAITRLGGLTNLVFRIDLGPQHYVLRVPGKGTQEYINRGHEAQAAREAARVQVSPEVLHFDTQTGVMVSRLVDAAVTMTPENFRARPGAPARAGTLMRQLH